MLASTPLQDTSKQSALIGPWGTDAKDPGLPKASVWRAEDANKPAARLQAQPPVAAEKWADKDGAARAAVIPGNAAPRWREEERNDPARREADRLVHVAGMLDQGPDQHSIRSNFHL